MAGCFGPCFAWLRGGDELVLEVEDQSPRRTTGCSMPQSSVSFVLNIATPAQRASSVLEPEGN